MRWDTLTGLEPETEEDHQRLRSEMRRFLSGIGRVCVVWLLIYTTMIGLTEEIWAEMSHELTIAGTTVAYSTLDPVILVAVCWGAAPITVACYNLTQLAIEAHQGPPEYDWDIEEESQQ